MRSLTVAGLLAALASGAGCGTGDGAADGSVLFVPASFREASHSMGHRRHIGATQADGGHIECRSCHDLTRDGFVSPQVRPCKRCHGDQAGFEHGPADGRPLPDGGTVSCLTCHTFAATAATISTPWVCLRCHAQPIAEAVAVKAHDAACFFCHLPHREPFTQPPDCTVCHPVSNPHGVKAVTATRSCSTCHQPHALAREASKRCIACHANPKAQKTRAAVVTRAALFEGHPSCGTCHVPHLFRKQDIRPCASCHEKQLVLARTFLATAGNAPKRASGHARCGDCHDPHQGNRAAPKTCETCHPDVKNSHPAPEGQPQHMCTQCHPAHLPLAGITVTKDCAECHREPQFAGLVHGKGKETGVPLTCLQCHPQHTFGKKMTDWSSCKECHQATLASAAKMRKAGHSNCEDCHEGLPHKPSLLNKMTWTKRKLCLSCHETMTPPQESHDECDRCHETHSGAKLSGCADCHKALELPGLHSVPKHQRCETCHMPHGLEPFTRRRTCLRGCHEKEAAHEPKTEHCHECHLFRPRKPGDLAVELKKK